VDVAIGYAIVSEEYDEDLANEDDNNNNTMGMHSNHLEQATVSDQTQYEKG